MTSLGDAYFMTYINLHANDKEREVMKSQAKMEFGRGILATATEQIVFFSVKEPKGTIQ